MDTLMDSDESTGPFKQYNSIQIKFILVKNTNNTQHLQYQCTIDA